MSRRASLPQPPWSPAQILALLLSALLAAPGCAEAVPEAEGTATATFSVDIEPPAEAPRPGVQSPRRSTLGFSPADVASLRVDVKETATGAPVYVHFDLVQGTSGWTGSLPFLPKGKMLTFSARAHGASNTLLFSGSTDQTLVSDNESVSITLAAANDGAAITLPRIKKIVLPGEFAFGQSGNVSFTIEGTANETLTYALLPAPSGGGFYPASGSITLSSGISGTFVSRYVPPVTVAAPTVLTHRVKVTNAAGHSVTTTFQTKLQPAGTGGDANGTAVSVLFNPVINQLSASRLAGTDMVVWEASVADDGPTSALAYAWSFTPSGTPDLAPSFTEQLNPTTLKNYTPALQGTLKLEVSDADGGKTTLLYSLLPNQFPDNASEMGALATLSASTTHTCVLLNDGNTRCWGNGTNGRLGYGNVLNYGDVSTRKPYTAGNISLGDTVVQVATGGAHTCALLRGGSVRCWGLNTSGQLGYGHKNSIGDDEAVLSQSYVNLGTRAVRIAAGDSHTCALLSTGKVRCWGYNGYGQLGYGHTQNIGDDESLWDVSDVQVGGTVYDLTASGNHTCALLAAGKVRCWGYNGYGQLGYGHNNNIGDDEHPYVANDVNVGGTVLQLSLGTHHTCALLDSGGLKCWGYNGYGQLGNGGATSTNTPGGHISLDSKALQVAAGGNHTCALLSSGGLKCWGYNGYGQLGYANTTALNAPASVLVNLGGASAHTLSAGANHTCALLSTGKALCWGHNNSGQLGYGHTLNVGDDEHPYTAGEASLLAP